MRWKNFLIPAKVQKIRDQLRAEGFRAVVKTLGWKVIAGIIIYYLVRDTLLYLVIPYLIARGVF